MTDAISDGARLAVLLQGAEYWIGVGEVPHQGAPTVAEMEALGWVKVRQSEVYGTWLMARRKEAA